MSDRRDRPGGEHPPERGGVVWHTVMSLDGFIAGPNGDMEWVFDTDLGQARTPTRVCRRLGALLVGRKTMEVEDRDRHGFYGGDFTGPFFVLSGDPPTEPPVVHGVTGRYLTGPADVAVETAHTAAGGKDVGILGATVAQGLLAAGRVDEVVVQVAPTLLGDGLPLFRGGAVQRMELVSCERDGDLADLVFRPRRRGSRR